MEERKKTLSPKGMTIPDSRGFGRRIRGCKDAKKNFRRKLYPLTWIQPTGIEEMPKNRIDWKRPGRLVSGVFTFYLIWT